MNFEASTDLSGEVEIKHIRNGKVIFWQVDHNLITDAGRAGVAARINGSGAPAAYTWIAIGTGTTAANVADTALGTEIASGGGSRRNAASTGTISVTTTTVTSDTAQIQDTFTFSSGFAVTEAGLLNASSTGTLLARQVFSAINVVNTDTLQVTWKIKAA